MPSLIILYYHYYNNNLYIQVITYLELDPSLRLDLKIKNYKWVYRYNFKYNFQIVLYYLVKISQKKLGLNRQHLPSGLERAIFTPYGVAAGKPRGNPSTTGPAAFGPNFAACRPKRPSKEGEEVIRLIALPRLFCCFPTYKPIVTCSTSW